MERCDRCIRLGRSERPARTEPPRPTAYIMAHRYAKLGQAEDPQKFFQTAKTDAQQIKDTELATLAESDAQKPSEK